MSSPRKAYPLSPPFTRVAKAFFSLFTALAILSGGAGAGARTGHPSCNVPTDASPSSLFGAGDFEQQLLRFEEFGRRDYETAHPPKSLPAPYSGYSMPHGDALDAFLGAGIFPAPTRDANPNIPNPWQSVIEATHTGPLVPLPGNQLASMADGRPPGSFFGHQRWDEFEPQMYFESLLTGSRVNNGLRDGEQLHGYKDGEFGPGADRISGTADDGLYHRVYEYHGPVHHSSPLAALADPVTGEIDLALDGTTQGIPIAVHPQMPLQDRLSIWTFDGTLPPKLLMARVGESILFRNHNALPIKFEANRGFGNHFISTHEHNGHHPAESDGFAQAHFLPGQFYDYHWPMVLAGHDSINVNASDDRAAIACEPGEEIRISLPGMGEDLAERLTSYIHRKEICPLNGRVRIPGDWRETMSTHWFHDHMIDYTAQNVYKGNAAMMNYYSALDRGNECWNDGTNLRFPSGCGRIRGIGARPPDFNRASDRSWGIRDYDVQLLVASKAWGQDSFFYEGGNCVTGTDEDGDLISEGQLWFAPFNTDGFVGDRMTVNWLYHPYLKVRARRYRLRILNGDVSRFMKLAFVIERPTGVGEFAGQDLSYDRVPFHLIANDGNIMEHATPHDGSMDLDRDGDFQDHHGILPTQAIAERYDIVIDFSRYDPGDKIYVVNLLEHQDGQGPEREIPLAEVLDGSHDSCDSTVERFLEIRVEAFVGTDLSMDPADYVPGRKKMIPLPHIEPEELETAIHRTFLFSDGGLTDSQPRNVVTDLYPTPMGESLLEVTDNGYEDVKFSEIKPEEPNSLSQFIFMCYEIFGQALDDAVEAMGLTKSEFFNDLNLLSATEKENALLPVKTKKAWGIGSDGSVPHAADMHRVSAAPVLGQLEIWHIENGSNMWSHNVHIHFEEGRILKRDGDPPPEWEKWARKDIYRIGGMDDSGGSVDVAIRFREFAGAYMSHCHNTQHEDHAMLLRYDIEHPGQLEPFLTPEPQWNGCSYSASNELSSASQRATDTGDAMARLEFGQHNSSDLLCQAGATDDCPGALDPLANEQREFERCDVDANLQVDARDLQILIGRRWVTDDRAGSGLQPAISCLGRCTYRGCSVGEVSTACGLVGLESLLVLIPLALRRRRRGGVVG